MAEIKGLLEDAGVAAVEERRSAERRPAQVQDSGLLGLARRKDEAASFEPHSPLIKLTPFLEEQRRALLSGVPEAEATENGVDDFDSARLLDAGATPPKRRRSTPCGEPSGGGGGGGGSSSSIGSSISSIGLLRKRSYGPGAESASLGSAFRAPLRPQRGVLVAEDGPRPTSAGQSSSDGEAGPETTEPTAPETRSLAAAGALLAPEAGAAVSGRRSSLRRRRRREDRGDEPGAQEEPGPEAPAAEPVKKTVRISSVEEEIRIESLDLVDQDELGGFGQQQEVRLVTARILGAEELATNGDGRPSGREEDLGRWTSRLRQFTDRPEDAAEDDEEAGPMAPQRAEPDSRLRPPPCLKPSASETALSRERRPDDNRISEKNLGPEIVMDLSRVTGDEEESESAARSAERVALDEDGRLLAATPSRAKRKLGRVSSDGAQLQAELVRFHLGGGSSPDEERTGRPCVGATERETTAPSTTERTVEATVAEEAVEGDGLARRQGRPVDEPRPTSRRGSSEASALGEEGEETEAEEEEEEAAADRARGLDEAPKEEPPPAPPDDEPDDVFEEARDESFASPATSAASRLSAERGRSPPPPLLVRQGRALGSPAPSEDLLGTDCSSPAALEDLEPESLDCSSTQSLLSASCRSFGSPRREAETQTQGEHKSTQYELEDLAELLCELYDRAAERPRERLGRLLEARFGSPRREAEVQTELESKAVQCVSEELAASGDFGPFRRPGRDWRASPRREAQVQTGQEAKSTQCRLGELAGEEERLRDEDDDDGDYGPPGQETICSRSPPLASAAASAAAAAAAAAGPATECPAARPGSPESSSPPPSGTASPSVSSSPRPGEESSSSSPPLILLVKGDPATVDMTVTHRDRDGNVVWAKHWGPERLVEIYREHQTSLGLSIVGGKVDLHDTGNSSKSPNVSGIFIKNVLPNSPAGRAGGLQTGDRIIEVDGVDLRNSTHERAVKAIQAAGNPVRLLVQSLVHLSPENNEEQDGEEASTGGGHRSGERSQGPRTSSVVRRRHDSPMKAGAEAIQEGRPDLKRQSSGATSDAAGPSGRRSSMKKSLRRKAPSPSPGGGAGGGALRELSEEPDEGPKSVGPTEPKNKYSSGESSEEEEDARELEGNVYTKNGVEISRKSAGNVKRSKEEIAADPEEEDDFGYTTNKVKKRYANLKEPVFLFKLDRERSGLGISLAGHKDRNKMSVFVCGLNPSGAAFKKGEIKIGDELLEVNGTVFQGRCHLNASSMIKGMPSISYKLVVVRRRSGIDNCAVKQVLHFPTALPGEDFSQYKGVRTVPIKKGTYGLGIMIIEGKHAEVGQGIFVSDIQEGGAAELAGLMVGDMILSVNADAVTGSTYDEAATLLKKAEGIVTLTVCNPNQSKVAEDEERLARGEPIEPAKDLKLEPEKPKEPEPPADPKTGKIVPHKDTTIEFPKDKDKPIGFSVVGGTDTPSKSVFVLDVFTDGAAGKDSRLQPGDRIVEINKESFKAMEQEKAYQTVLRITQGPIIMIVHRDEKAVEEIEVELTKKSGKGSGLVLMGYKSGKGAYVSEVVAGGSAAESGKISKGDRVVAIGGQDLREAPVEDIALHVKVSNPLQLKLARYKTK